jgi:hypothetical protein
MPGQNRLGYPPWHWDWRSSQPWPFGEHEREAETIEVVATGPASPHVSLRHTKAVLLQLVDAARRELMS